MRQVPVLIIGAGPVGLTLANLLGAAGIETRIIDASSSTSDLPRAILIDDESFRTFQSFELDAQVRSAVVYGTGARYYSAGGKLLAAVRPLQGPYGFAKRSALDQPALERLLLANLGRYPSVTVSFSTRLLELQTRSEGERATLEGLDGTEQIDAQWVVGCDGGRSSVRELSGIRMIGSSFQQKWVIVDVRNDPDDSRYTKFLCDPRRPTVSVPAPGGGRRYEFMLHPQEEAKTMLSAPSIAALTSPYRMLDATDIVRKTVYTFHALSADRYRQGRRLLAGDAAHMMPPFAGQGMNSGIRDAHNLAWKLALAVTGRAGAGLLDSYDAERRDHAEAMIALSVRLGAVVMPTSRMKASIRDLSFKVLSLVPSVKNWVASMRWKPTPRYRSGCLVDPGQGVIGTMLPQPEMIEGDGGSTRLDDRLGPGFALIGQDPEALNALRDPLWDRLGAARMTILTDDRIARAPNALSDRTDGIAACFARHRGKILLIRPDRYVAGAFAPAGEAAFAARFTALLDASALPC